MSTVSRKTVTFWTNTLLNKIEKYCNVLHMYTQYKGYQGSMPNNIFNLSFPWNNTLQEDA